MGRFLRAGGTPPDVAWGPLERGVHAVILVLQACSWLCFVRVHVFGCVGRLRHMQWRLSLGTWTAPVVAVAAAVAVLLLLLLLLCCCSFPMACR